MGLCFSKKQQVRRRREEQQPCNEARKTTGIGGGGKKAGAKEVAIVPEAKKAPPQAKPAPSRKAAPKAEEPAADKRTVFVVKAAAAAAAAEVAASANGEAADEEVKRPAPEEEAKPVVVSRVPVRTSSCTKEEVDAILIQCGRLSRSSSSSGKVASGEGGGGHRRYSGSKRSYDFDRERRGGSGVDDDCDWERQGAAVSRPSPRRRTPERKRSGSHERSGGSGSRRVSRSPGRRADSVPATASGERASRQQPGKMVSVPAREKGRAPSPVPAASGKRCPSPRSNSPARAGAAGNENAAAQPAHGPSLSRSSSRKAEHSPYRRNPMAELDENTLANHHNSNNNGRPQKKPTESGGALPQKVAERAKDQVAASRTAAKEKQEIVEVPVASSDTKGRTSGRMKATHSVSIVAESVVNQKGRSSRRSSRDFDNNGNSYASLLLEDIQNYHQSTGAAAPAPSFSLPACVSKACSILEAVADLNSSSSENKSFELDRSANDKCSANGRYGDGKVAGGGTFVVESEVVVKDDLMEPSLHKYVSVRDIRGEAEPQESAGSNSFAGNAWTPSWEPNSVDSTDRTWTASQSNNGDEVEQLSSGAVSPLELSWQSKQKLPSQEPSGGRSRLGSTGNAQRGRSAHRGGGGGGAVNARSDVRAAPASSSIA
uniref:OO_Ba0013J05-OO_Ba0033A15.14 protein n=1 Tax=Oryza officinalis TaxID=4535 RepID=D0ABF7_9ORYZ|nr:OO_Ba0013J05-OO_Ba0033A15.14 [Oryza officinalis]